MMLTDLMHVQTFMSVTLEMAFLVMHITCHVMNCYDVDRLNVVMHIHDK